MVRTSIIAVVTAAALLPGCATSPSDSTVEGTVTGVYLEVMPGVLLAPEVAHDADAAPRWAEVRLDPVSTGRDRTFARIDTDADIGVGDVVTVERGNANTGPASFANMIAPGISAESVHRPPAPPTRVALVHSVRVRAEIDAH